MKLQLPALCLCLFSQPCCADESKTVSAVQLHEIKVEQADRNVSITLVVFSAQDFSTQVIDNAGENDSARFSSLSSAMEAKGCVAGCNGGFFNRHPFTPVGGMISGGHQIAPIDPNTWMKGLLVVRNRHPTLEAVDSFQLTADITDLLQSGIWLVHAGKPQTDSDQSKLARRTFIGHDGKGTWAIGTSERCTFHELAAMLKSPEVTAIIDIQEALNFDGGPSTGLWLQRSSGNFYLPEKWPVRNYIGIVPRPTKSAAKESANPP